MELNILCDKPTTLVSHPPPSCLAAATMRWQQLTGMCPKPAVLAQQACTANCCKYRDRCRPLACIPDAPNLTSTKCHRPFLSTHNKSATGETPSVGAGNGTCESTGANPHVCSAPKIAIAAPAARWRQGCRTTNVVTAAAGTLPQAPRLVPCQPIAISMKIHLLPQRRYGGRPCLASTEG